MIVEVLFLIAYGITSFVGIYLVIYVGLPTQCLAGVHAYVLFGDDTVASAAGGASARAAVAAGGQGKSKTSKGKGKSSKKSDDWDEELAKVVRFQIPEIQIIQRPDFDDYNHSFIYVLAVAFMIMARLAAEPVFNAFLVGPQLRAAVARADVVLLLFGFVAVSTLLSRLFKVQYDPKTTQQVDFTMGTAAGVAGFLIALMLLFTPASQSLDFHLDKAIAAHLQALPGTTKASPEPPLTGTSWQGAQVGEATPGSPGGMGVEAETEHADRAAKKPEAVEEETEFEGSLEDEDDPPETPEEAAAGYAAMIKLFLAGFAAFVSYNFMPATTRLGRCYCQLSSKYPWAQSVLQYSSLYHTLSSLALVLAAAAHLGWIVPIMDVFIPQSVSDFREAATCPASDVTCGDGAWNVFNIVRHVLLFLSSIVSASLLRIVVQAHLDTAFVFWYQQIHSPGGSDPKKLTQKMQTALYFLCKVAMQCVVPPFTIFLLQALSWACAVMDIKSIPVVRVSSPLLHEILVMAAWWCTTIWTAQTIGFLVLHRLGQIR